MVGYRGTFRPHAEAIEPALSQCKYARTGSNAIIGEDSPKSEVAAAPEPRLATYFTARAARALIVPIVQRHVTITRLHSLPSTAPIIETTPRGKNYILRYTFPLFIPLLSFILASVEKVMVCL